MERAAAFSEQQENSDSSNGFSIIITNFSKSYVCRIAFNDTESKVKYHMNIRPYDSDESEVEKSYSSKKNLLNELKSWIKEQFPKPDISPQKLKL